MDLAKKPSNHDLYLKVVCKCCGKNEFQDPADDDSEGLVSFFGHLEDAMSSLPFACSYHRLKSIAILDTNNDNASKFIMNRLLHPPSKEAEPNFDHIRFCSPDQFKLDSFLEMTNILYV